MMANVLTLFGIPQISHTSSSDLLSDKNKFPYFMRLIPPDRFQVCTSILNNHIRTFSEETRLR